MSELEQLQQDVEALLLSDSELQYVTVTSLRPRSAAEATSIQSKLNQMLSGKVARNGKAGLAAVVGMPEIREANGNLRSLNGQLTLVVEVIEDVIINMGAAGTLMSCEEAALRIAALLQHRSFDGVAALTADERVLVPKREGVIEGKVEYEVRMRVNFGQAAPELVATPTATVAGAQLSLTTATSGAAIYYTTNGSYPGPGNPAATLYATAVTLEAGNYLIRAAAHKTGMAASGERRLELAVT